MFEPRFRTLAVMAAIVAALATTTAGAEAPAHEPPSPATVADAGYTGTRLADTAGLGFAKFAEVAHIITGAHARCVVTLWSHPKAVLEVCDRVLGAPLAWARNRLVQPDREELKEKWARMAIRTAAVSVKNAADAAVECANVGMLERWLGPAVTEKCKPQLDELATAAGNLMADPDPASVPTDPDGVDVDEEYVPPVFMPFGERAGGIVNSIAEHDCKLLAYLDIENASVVMADAYVTCVFLNKTTTGGLHHMCKMIAEINRNLTLMLSHMLIVVHAPTTECSGYELPCTHGALLATSGLKTLSPTPVGSDGSRDPSDDFFWSVDLHYTKEVFQAYAMRIADETQSIVNANALYRVRRLTPGEVDEILSKVGLSRDEFDVCNRDYLAHGSNSSACKRIANVYVSLAEEEADGKNMDPIIKTLIVELFAPAEDAFLMRKHQSKDDADQEQDVIKPEL